MYLTPAHPFTVTDTAEGREYVWEHPAACRLRGDDCEIERRITRSGRQGADVFHGLADGRPAGAYLLGLYHFHGLVLVDDRGRMLPDRPSAEMTAAYDVTRRIIESALAGVAGQLIEDSEGTVALFQTVRDGASMAELLARVAPDIKAHAAPVLALLDERDAG